MNERTKNQDQKRQEKNKTPERKIPIQRYLHDLQKIRAQVKGLLAQKRLECNKMSLL